MSSYKTLDEWYTFAHSKPFVVEKDDKHWVVNGRVERKPENWREVLKVVGRDRCPISESVARVINNLCDVEIDRWDPWPVLAKLKDSKKLHVFMNPDFATVVMESDMNHITLTGFGSGLIWQKWNCLGFEHDDLLWFAALLTPQVLNKCDPWLGLMEWKKSENVSLQYSTGVFVAITANGMQRPFVAFPCSMKVKELVRMFNDGEIPPGCVTDWDPFYSAAEALLIIKKAYGTPEFDKLRFHTNKLRR